MDELFAIELHRPFQVGGDTVDLQRRVLVRVDAILSVTAKKKGCRIMIEGGFAEDVQESYDDVIRAMRSAASATAIEDVSSPPDGSSRSGRD
jgi:hypothetical protein